MSLCLVTINLYSAVFIQRFQVQFKLPSDRMTVSKSIVSFHLFSFFICSVKLESNTNYCWHISRFCHDFDPNKDNIVVPNLLRFLFESFGTNFKTTAVFNLFITWGMNLECFIPSVNIFYMRILFSGCSQVRYFTDGLASTVWANLFHTKPIYGHLVDNCRSVLFITLPSS